MLFILAVMTNQTGLVYFIWSSKAETYVWGKIYKLIK
jgi:hypothetical protein